MVSSYKTRQGLLLAQRFALEDGMWDCAALSSLFKVSPVMSSKGSEGQWLGFSPHSCSGDARTEGFDGLSAKMPPK